MSNASQPETNGKKGGLTKTHIIMICGFVLVIAAIAVVYFLLKPQPAPALEPEQNLGNFVIDENNLGAITDAVSDKIEKGRFMTYMNTSWTFPDGASPSSNAVIGNSPANNYPFYFTITIDSTGEIVYTSTLIPVGSVVKELKLETELPAGTYEATCTYHLIDENNEEQGGDVGMAVTLTIRN